MRRTTIAALTTALAFCGSAQASGKHWCSQGDPAIQASANTSCAFAGTIYTRWVNAGTPLWWKGTVRSPVTRRRYAITCWRTDHRNWWSNTVTCYGTNGIWLKTGMP